MSTQIVEEKNKCFILLQPVMQNRLEIKRYHHVLTEDSVKLEHVPITTGGFRLGLEVL